MKKVILYLYILFLSIVSIAQNHDKVWFLGYTGNAYPMGHYTMSFESDSLVMNTHYDVPIALGGTNSSMCDSAGNFLFVTNGDILLNANLDTMQNGIGLGNDSLPQGWHNFGIPFYQASMALPSPNNIMEYYLFQIYYRDGLPQGKGLIYSRIDMTLDNGLGSVTDKNVKLIQDSLYYTGITAVKHANGKDWWVVIPRVGGKTVYTILLTSMGIKSIELQNIGNSDGGITMYCLFSSNGLIYTQHINNAIRIFNFDRCSGHFSNPKIILAPFSSSSPPSNLVISPNNHFLYYIIADTIYQYNLWASNINATKTIVAITDGFTYTYPGSQSVALVFKSAQLAPNGKIYISSGFPYMHVIHAPDSQGTSCNVEQHFPVPAMPFSGFPHFPNYRLGASPSFCDTTSSNEEGIGKKEKVLVYPNPTQNYVQVELPQGLREATFVLYNALGQVVQQTDLQASTLVRLGNVAKGLYFYHIVSPKKEVVSYGKLQVE
ncbi:MAG: T9SS type A sorting domain-containing protein [Bacteroidia bacterium]